MDEIAAGRLLCGIDRVVAGLGSSPFKFLEISELVEQRGSDLAAQEESVAGPLPF